MEERPNWTRYLVFSRGKGEMAEAAQWRIASACVIYVLGRRRRDAFGKGERERTLR